MEPGPSVTEAWVGRAVRGSATRSAVCAPLAAVAGLLVSLPQALFTVGIGCGLVVALTFGERWLTRRGVQSGEAAAVAGCAAWIVASLACGLFVAQVNCGYGSLAWAEGPALANEALLEQLGEASFPAVLLIGIVMAPVALTFGGYVYSWNAAEALAPTSLVSVFVCGAWSLLAFLLAAMKVDPVESLALGVGMFLVSMLYQLVSIALALGVLAATGYLEERVFQTHKVRWDPDVRQGTRVKRPGLR